MVINLDRKELKAINIYFIIEFQIVCLVMIYKVMKYAFQSLINFDTISMVP